MNSRQASGRGYDLAIMRLERNQRTTTSDGEEEVISMRRTEQIQELLSLRADAQIVRQIQGTPRDRCRLFTTKLQTGYVTDFRSILCASCPASCMLYPEAPPPHLNKRSVSSG